MFYILAQNIFTKLSEIEKCFNCKNNKIATNNTCLGISLFEGKLFIEIKNLTYMYTLMLTIPVAENLP